MRFADKLKAIALRKQGKSYREIQAAIRNISKATISNWLSGLSMTFAEKKLLMKRIKDNRENGLSKSILMKKEMKHKRSLFFKIKAEKLFNQYQKNTFFISGIVLYWAEGTKTTESVHFMNSDYRLILFMLKWFKKFLKIPIKKIRARLYIHKIYAYENHEFFWKKIIKIPQRQFLKTIYKPTPHLFKRNPLYRGCIRIDAGGIDAFTMIRSWQELLSKRYRLLHP